jgi:hypothetical protein
METVDWVPVDSFHRVLSCSRSGITVAAAATLDSEKFRTEINTPRARENVRRTGVVTLYKGRALKGGDLVTRITVTSSIFNFST